MIQLASFVRVPLGVGLAVVLSGACGGQSFESGGDGGGGSASQAGSIASAGRAKGGSASGGSASAGAAAGGSGAAGAGAAGSASTGGSGATGAGGSASAGTASGGSGAAGGAAFDEACDAPPVVGTCKAAIARWYNESSTGICRPFTYGGCGGNKNNYDTLAACQKACPNEGPQQFDSCQVASDCVVRGAECCGPCDGPDTTAHDLIAYNKKYSNAINCGPLPPPVASGGAGAFLPAPPIIACEPCRVPLAGTGTLKYFVPDCVQRQCVVADLRNSPLTACKRGTDCRVRHGNACCESCSNDNLLAVRSDGSFENLICGGVPAPCLACLPPPSDAVAVCSMAGHCELQDALVPLPL